MLVFASRKGAGVEARASLRCVLVLEINSHLLVTKQDKKKLVETIVIKLPVNTVTFF